MAKYCKKQTLVDAWQINAESDIKQTGANIRKRLEGGDFECYDKLYKVWIQFDLGDWIIRGATGEYYPCKEEVFFTMYEPVE